MRMGQVKAAEHQWRAQARIPAARPAVIARPALRDNRGFWLAVCLAIAFAVALLR